MATKRARPNTETAEGSLSTPSKRREERSTIERCAMCLVEFEIPDRRKSKGGTHKHSIAAINACGHMFHQHCWVDYVKTHIKNRARAAFEAVEWAELRCPLCRGKVEMNADGGPTMTWIPRERKKPRDQQIVQARRALAMWRDLEEEIKRCDKDTNDARTAQVLLEIIHRWADEEEKKLAALTASVSDEAEEAMCGVCS